MMYRIKRVDPTGRISYALGGLYKFTRTDNPDRAKYWKSVGFTKAHLRQYLNTIQRYGYYNTNSQLQAMQRRAETTLSQLTIEEVDILPTKQFTVEEFQSYNE